MSKYESPFAYLFEKPKKKRGRPKNPTRERFEIALDKTRDKDVIKRLNQEPNKSEYVRRLILEDIKKDTQ